MVEQRPEQSPAAGDDTWPPDDEGPVVVDAQSWAVEGYDPDDPWESELQLWVDDGAVVAIPLVDDIVDAVLVVARAQGRLDDGAAYATPEPPARRARWDDDADEVEDDDRQPDPVGGVARVTGWHQVDVFWNGLTPGGRIAVAAAVVAVLLIAFVAANL